MVPPVVWSGTSNAGPFALLSMEKARGAVFPPPPLLDEPLLPPPLLQPHAVAASASRPLTATSRTPVLRLMY